MSGLGERHLAEALERPDGMSAEEVDAGGRQVRVVGLAQGCGHRGCCLHDALLFVERGRVLARLDGNVWDLQRGDMMFLHGDACSLDALEDSVLLFTR